MGNENTGSVDNYLTDLRASLEQHHLHAASLLNTTTDEEDRRGLQQAVGTLETAILHLEQIENSRLSGFDHPVFDPPPAPLTTEEAAKRLKVAKITVQKWVKAGLFPNAAKFGRDWVIPPADLEGFTPPPMGRPRRVPVTA